MAAFVAVITTACGGGATRTLTVVNDTEYEITVEISSGDGSRVPLETLPRNSRDVSDEVPDQGDRWVFHFSSAGVEAGSVERTRSQLKDDNWTVDVPSSAADELKAANVAPAPRHAS